MFSIRLVCAQQVVLKLFLQEEELFGPIFSQYPIFTSFLNVLQKLFYSKSKKLQNPKFTAILDALQ